MWNIPEGLESWQVAFRYGFVPQLSLAGLQSLQIALENDDPKLLQGVTTFPPPVYGLSNEICEGGDAIAWCFRVDGARTVGEVEEAFAKSCFEADRLLGEPTACRRFLNAYDSWPRSTMRRLMLAEVAEVIAARIGEAQPA